MRFFPAGGIYWGPEKPVGAWGVALTPAAQRPTRPPSVSLLRRGARAAQGRMTRPWPPDYMGRRRWDRGTLSKRPRLPQALLASMRWAWASRITAPATKKTAAIKGTELTAFGLP